MSFLFGYKKIKMYIGEAVVSFYLFMSLNYLEDVIKVVVQAFLVTLWWLPLAVEALWLASFITAEEDAGRREVVAAGVVPDLVRHLGDRKRSRVIPALRATGHLVMGDDNLVGDSCAPSSCVSCVPWHTRKSFPRSSLVSSLVYLFIIIYQCLFIVSIFTVSFLNISCTFYQLICLFSLLYGSSFVLSVFFMFFFSYTRLLFSYSSVSSPVLYVYPVLFIYPML